MRFFDCNPLLGKANGCRYRRLLHQNCSVAEGLLARGVRVRVRAPGMYVAERVCVRRGGGRLCYVTMVVATNHGGNQFATREQGCTEPEYGPSCHQSRAQALWPAGLRRTRQSQGRWHPGDPAAGLLLAEEEDDQGRFAYLVHGAGSFDREKNPQYGSACIGRGNSVVRAPSNISKGLGSRPVTLRAFRRPPDPPGSGNLAAGRHGSCASGATAWPPWPASRRSASSARPCARPRFS